MKNIYRFIFILFFLGSFVNVNAQKQLLLRVNQVQNTNNADCDGDVWPLTLNEEWMWKFGGDANGWCYETSCNRCNHTHTPNVTIWGNNTYYSRECWPANISVRFIREENDGISSCDDGGACADNDTWTTPAYNAANNTYNQTGATTGSTTITRGCSSGCGSSTINYNYNASWVVAGSNFNAGNLDANSYVSNKTCANAIDIDGGTEATGSRFTNHANQCTDVWYAYDVTSTNLTNLTFNGANGTVTVFYDASASCNTSCSVASGAGGVSLGGPVSPGRYYIRISSNGSTTGLSVSKSTGTNNNDYIANASNLGTISSAGGHYSTQLRKQYRLNL